MERQLPGAPDCSRIWLRIWDVPVETLTEKGQMFEPEGASSRDVRHETAWLCGYIYLYRKDSGFFRRPF